MKNLNEKLINVIIKSRSKATLGEAFRDAFLYKFHNAKEEARVNYIRNRTIKDGYSVLAKDINKLRTQLNGYPVKKGDKLTAVDRNIKTNVKASKDRIFVLAGLRGYLEVDKDAVHVVNEGFERRVQSLLKQHGVHYAKFRYGEIHVQSSTIAKKVKKILDLDTGVHYTPNIHSPGMSYTGSTAKESVGEEFISEQIKRNSEIECFVDFDSIIDGREMDKAVRTKNYEPRKKYIGTKRVTFKASNVAEIKRRFNQEIDKLWKNVSSRNSYWLAWQGGVESINGAEGKEWHYLNSRWHQDKHLEYFEGGYWNTRNGKAPNQKYEKVITDYELLESLKKVKDSDQTHQEAVVNWEAEANATDIQQKKIAIETVKNPAKALLGGMSEEQAVKILKNVHRYTDGQITKLREVNKKK